MQTYNVKVAMQELNRARRTVARIEAFLVKEKAPAAPSVEEDRTPEERIRMLEHELHALKDELAIWQRKYCQEVVSRPGSTTGHLSPEKLADILDLDCYNHNGA